MRRFIFLFVFIFVVTLLFAGEGVDIYITRSTNELINKGLVDEAIVELQKALSSNPNKDTEILLRKLLANSYYIKNIFSKAISEYEKAIYLGANGYDVHIGLGKACYKKGFFELAIYEFKQALSKGPENIDYAMAYYYLSAIYVLKGERGKAIENLRMAIELNPQAKEIAKSSKEFDNIREEREFQELLK